VSHWRRRKTDVNHAEIKAALEQCGWRVLDLSAVGGGVPDLLAHHPERITGWTFVEVKRPGVMRVKPRGRLHAETRERQAQFASRWPVVVIESVEQAVRL
jgi:hypothetical protein